MADVFLLFSHFIFVWSKYSGTDPEHSPGSWGIAYDWEQTPRSRSVTMNIQVGF